MHTFAKTYSWPYLCYQFNDLDPVVSKYFLARRFLPVWIRACFSTPKLKSYVSLISHVIVFWDQLEFNQINPIYDLRSVYVHQWVLRVEISIPYLISTLAHLSLIEPIQAEFEDVKHL